jgi:hypothetical protein
VLNSYQVSSLTTDETLTPDPSCDIFSDVIGNPTGTLAAGLGYRVNVQAEIQGFNVGSPGTASGFISLAGVPEPSTAPLIGSAGLVFAGRTPVAA